MGQSVESARALDTASTLLQSGKLLEAEQLCAQLISAEPENAEAHHLFGLIAFEKDDLGLAEEHMAQAAHLVPDDAVYLCNLGNIQFARGDLEAALSSYEKSATLDAGIAQAHANLGLVLTEVGRLDEGIAALERALALNPEDAEALLNLGNAFRGRAEIDKAVGCYRRVVDIAPRYAEAHRNLGGALAEMGRFDEAQAAFHKSLQLRPQYKEAYTELGLTLVAQGRFNDAAAHFIGPVRAFRSPQERPLDAFMEFNKINKTKLTHDAEQFDYLEARGDLPEEFAGFADEHREAMDRLGESYEGLLSDLDPLVSKRMRTSYNRIIHHAPAAAVEGGAVSPNIDIEKIERDFFDSPHDFTYFDGFLRPEALESLRAFCLESTIWSLLDYENELESNLLTGFCCPLILQIAAETKTTFPGIFGDHMFTSCWAYKYFQRQSGLGVHCDDGAYSINFWITPDEANNDPDSGGLVLWNKKVSRDYLGEMTEDRQARFQRLLSEPDAESFRVPYRCNRAVLFRSSVLHGTDAIDFKPGYENNRINMTFLYGKAPRSGQV